MTVPKVEVNLLAQWQELLGRVDDDNQHATRAQFIALKDVRS